MSHLLFLFFYIPWFEAHDILPLVDPQTNAWEVPLFGFTLPIQPFGVLVATGVLLGTRIAEEFGRRNGINPQVITDLATYSILGGFTGAFFLNALFYDPDKLLAFLQGDFQYLGLSSYGGFLGATLGLVLWKRKRGWPMIAAGDAGVFGFPFGWLFGRTGCFITHDHPGQVTDFFLAVDNYRGGGDPRHDLGLYEVFWSIGVVLLFLFLARTRRRPGFYMALFCILYAPIRFGLDFLRATPANGGDIRYAGLTPGQYGSLALLLAGVGLFWWIYNHDPVTMPPDAIWPPPDENETSDDAPTAKGAAKKGPAAGRRAVARKKKPGPSGSKKSRP